MNATPWLLLMCIALGAAACGDDEDSTDAAGGAQISVPAPTAGGGACFLSDDCAPGSYCRATDALVSPEGSCAPWEAAGGTCVSGEQCASGLFCKNTRNAVNGVCEAFPASCASAPTCECAMAACATLAGSSCSPSSLSNVAETITVTCAP